MCSVFMRRQAEIKVSLTDKMSLRDSVSLADEMSMTAGQCQTKC